MHFLIYCTDGPGADEKRQRELQAHMDYVESVLDQLAVAGPLTDESNGASVGSCYVVKAETRDEAKQLVAGDPFHQAGVFAEVAISQFTPAAGDWVPGGKIW